MLIKNKDGEEFSVEVTYCKKFADCWNVYIEQAWEDNSAYPVVLSMSDNPSHPQGVFSVTDRIYFCVDSLADEEEIKDWNELPEKCKQAIYDWVNEQQRLTPFIKEGYVSFDNATHLFEKSKSKRTNRHVYNATFRNRIKCLIYYEEKMSRYFENGKDFPSSTNEARKLIGKAITFLRKEDIDRSGRGYFFPRQGKIIDVFGKQACFENQEWVGFSDIVEYMENE